MSNQSAQAVAVPEQQLNHARSTSAFRSAKLLIGLYAGVSVVTLGAIVALHNHASLVNSAVWVRGVIVVASSLLMLSFAVRAARGSRTAYLRLRIASAVMVVAIAVILSLPGMFPMWMKVEQSICGLILIGVVAVVNGRHLRSVFATR